VSTAAPRRLVVLGAVGTCLLAVGGFGLGAVPAHLVGSWLHSTTTGQIASSAMCLGGLGALLVAWWRLRGSSPRFLLLAAATWSIPLLAAPPLFSRDVYAYAGQGHLVDVGLDPYMHGPADAPGPLANEVDAVWSHARSPYGPVFLRLAAWLVPGQHVLTSVLLLRLLAVAGLGLVAWGLWRLATDPSRALWLAVANPLVLLHGVGGAHNDVLMAGLLIAGLAVASTGGLVLGAALVTTAALVKLPAVAGLAFLPLLRPGARRRAVVVVAATGAVTAAGLTTASGLGWGWLHSLGAGNARRSLLSLSTGLGVLVSNVAGDAAVGAAHAAGLGVAALTTLALLVRAGRVGPLRALGLALLAVVVLGPVVQPWYLVWVLVVLAAVAGHRLGTGLAAASAVLCLLILPGGRHVIRPPLYGVPSLVVIAAGYAAARPALWAKRQQGRIEPCADPRSP
jgi:hypothetical protein